MGFSQEKLSELSKTTQLISDGSKTTSQIGLAQFIFTCHGRAHWAYYQLATLIVLNSQPILFMAGCDTNGIQLGI